MLEECAEWCEQILPYCDLLEPDLNAGVKSVYIYKSVSASRREKAYAVASELGDLAEQCTVPMLRSNLWRWRAVLAKDYDTACAAFEKAIELAKLGSTTPVLVEMYGVQAIREVMLPKCILYYGQYLAEKGELARASDLVAEAEEINRSIGDSHGVAYSLGEQGKIAFLREEYNRAYALFDQAVKAGVGVGSPDFVCLWQPWQGIAALCIHEFEEARGLLAASREACRKYGHPHLESIACCFSAEEALHARRADDARRWLAEGDALSPGCRDSLNGYLELLRKHLQATPPPAL
jgi:tetratricopeptide (TPR) repeat protein